MKKYLLTIMVSLIVGFFLGNFLLKQYDEYNGIKVSNISNEVYFIQYGVYETIESMEQNTINLENYIYNIEDNKYHVYIGITKNEKNIEKIQNYFKTLGYETIVKSYYISNEKFISILENYDQLLNQTEDQMALASVISQILQEYEEIVNGNKN